LRAEFKEYGGLNEAQIIALVVLAITVPLLVTKARLIKKEPEEPARRRRSRRREGRAS
jgi:hypothetical protein